MLEIALVAPYRIPPDLRHLELWFQVRREDGPLDGLLEWPGGKIEKGEAPVSAAQRELTEEVPTVAGLDWSRQRLQLFNIYHHRYPDRDLSFHLYLWKADDIPLETGGWKSLELGASSALTQLALPDANRPMIHELHQYFCQQLKSGARPWAL